MLGTSEVDRTDIVGTWRQLSGHVDSMDSASVISVVFNTTQQVGIASAEKVDCLCD